MCEKEREIRDYESKRDEKLQNSVGGCREANDWF